MLLSYYTVKGYGEHEINIQKSRFIAYIQRAETEQEAQGFIQSIKKKHHDANHNCSAYLIGENDQIQKANDDGEPSGTAGVPILEVLKKRKLKNTVVVITRYFGGIKLGAGGLIRAYGTSTSEGLNTAGIVERKLMAIIVFQVNYSLLGKFENEIRNSSYPLKAINYSDDVEFQVCVPVDERENFIEWVTDLSNGNIKIAETTEKEYMEQPVTVD
ncbi:YigZ family protein [Pseudalkalibacillus salsuginis]|uniref:YigZ family protein n=1 Tax=Pseudalkalibacillus salsuginis TaxID=2910972 RepID=UPI001F34F7C4|nr:YigZ family protein [Pseudalkalibacillus salsuginis]MCF6410137.1 YigZ family protein [Pseudalkalibacillus salsuginis]